MIAKPSPSWPTSPEWPRDAHLRSHTLPKFLKRLRAADRPRLLDLGRLCGSNIEFFARLGCRVQVEDLWSHLDEEPGREGPDTETPRREAPRTEAPFPRAVERSRVRTQTGSPPAASRATASGLEAAGGISLRPSSSSGGRRPSRRIVLPARTFRPTATVAPPRPPGTAAPRAAAARSPLVTRLSYPDESFDAIIAWDIFNYYDSASMHLAAAEARRILKPGGLLFCLFHARRLEGPDQPRRFQILDETRLAAGAGKGRPLSRHVFHNRDIEKMFAGMKITELYFLKSALREILMEKKGHVDVEPQPPSRWHPPRPRFRIE